jgi:hypothetical protein
VLFTRNALTSSTQVAPDVDGGPRIADFRAASPPPACLSASVGSQVQNPGEYADPSANPARLGDQMIVYLDMNVWVQMAVGVKKADPRWTRVRARLLDAVADGRVSFPLSAAHYLELWHRRDAASREDVARLMSDMSRYATLKPIQQIQAMEVTAAATTAITGSACAITRADLLGEGVNHAFNSPLGRLRLVESLASDGNPEGPPSSLPDWLDLAILTGPVYEWNSLVGPHGMVQLDFDRTPEHRLGTEYAEREQALREWLVADPARRKHLEAIVVAEEINALADDISECAGAYGQPPQAVLLGSGQSQLDPPEAGRAFIRAMPVADVIVTVRVWKHQDTTHPWDQHDKTDLMSIGVAIPYCDVVVTERRWAHMATVTGLSDRYDTKVGHGLPALEALAEGFGGV